MIERKPSRPALAMMQLRLLDWALSKADQPFAWGITDCTTLMLEAVDLQMGTRFRELFSGAWRSPLTAARMSRKIPVPEWLRNIGAVRAEQPSMGDILVAEAKPWTFCHVCLGRHSLSAQPGAEVVLCSTNAIMANGATAWRVDAWLR